MRDGGERICAGAWKVVCRENTENAPLESGAKTPVSSQTWEPSRVRWACRGR